jgi:hypothetical protein
MAELSSICLPETNTILPWPSDEDRAVALDVLRWALPPGGLQQNRGSRSNRGSGMRNSRRRRLEVAESALLDVLGRWLRAGREPRRTQDETGQWIILARVQRRRGDGPGAGIAARRAARDAGSEGELLACGLCALEIGEHQLADRLFSCAIERSSGDGDPVAHLGRAVAAYRLGDLAESARWLTLGERRLHPPVAVAVS